MSKTKQAAVAKKPPAKAGKAAPKKQAAPAPHPVPPPEVAEPAGGAVVLEHDVLLERLHVDPANARRHGERNMAAIVASLREHGQVEPLVVQRSSGRIVGGNGRYEAMRLLGWQRCLVGWVDISDTAATKLGVTLNRSAELAEWDVDTLDRLLAGLEDQGVDVSEVGFTADELDDLLGEAGDDLDAEPAGEPGKLGDDVWVLGKHRLVCGESHQAATCTVCDVLVRRWESVTNGKATREKT